MSNDTPTITFADPSSGRVLSKNDTGATMSEPIIESNDTPIITQDLTSGGRVLTKNGANIIINTHGNDGGVCAISLWELYR